MQTSKETRKKADRFRSITFRITLWSSIILLLVVTLTFLLFRIVSASVLQKTAREYLLSSVNENTGMIDFLTDEERAQEKDKDNVFLRCGNGWLEIDDDFLDVINEVRSALYTEDGVLLYGKDPFAKTADPLPFTDSRIYLYEDADAARYFVYDRKLNEPGMEDLWIRGTVPLSLEELQLEGIFRPAVIFLPMLMLLGILGSGLSTLRALRPVRRIQQTAAEITTGTDLGRRIEMGKVDVELRDLADAFNGMLDRLEHSFAAEQQFTSDASHELRTPVSVILAQTELALDRERTGEEYRKALSVIRRQSRRMNILINSMLDYSRLEMRPENYPFEEMDLSGIAASCAGDLSVVYQDRTAFVMEIEPDIRIKGNPLLVERAVQNVLQNACKYGRRNGHVTFRLSEESDGSAVCRISDDGPGIPLQEQERIFERFYRVDPSRSSDPERQGVPGAGLGLSMTRKIMEIHGGRIELQSVPGEGSTFSLIFPGSV